MRRPAGIVTRSFGAAAAPSAPHARAPLPPAVATGQPSPAYRRHHDVTAPQVDSTAFRQGWLVCSRLDQLLEADAIDREQWDCAHEWRRWAEIVTPYGRQQWDVRVSVSAVPNDSAMLLRVTAASRLREAAAALGELRIRVLEAVVVRDLSWSELGRLLRLSDKPAKDRTIEALEALADWRTGRAVAPPPVLRYRRNGVGAG